MGKWWLYRGFVLSSVKRDFQARYRNSLLGPVWPLLQPLAMIVIYTLVFSQVMQARLPGLHDGLAYGIYICCGILTWGLFAEVTNRCLSMFLDNANLLKKLSFPRLCLPLIVLLGALLNFAITLGIFLLVLVIIGRFPGESVLALPLLIGLQLIFALGIGMTLGVLNVFFRDIGQLFAIALQLWFWLTPIVYPANILPASLQPWLALNPMTGLMQSYQGIFLHNAWPDWQALLPIVVTGLLSCAVAACIFRSKEADMLDEI
ncbi:ABC transporter permease [Pseudomonas sp. TTU2014-080ASC]|uniref:ABC transporter permease n=1 Tax=Pseudomonas sp. TTU2014-080ASC TaxID=1729724 RepID=UPI0007187949|nr:ABC transporter permease [Pseudomonas sp. TTU2014-080ASC]KRW60863.1 ABC transporter [Pseudomonas sp. TTU2014-080ASC]